MDRWRIFENTVHAYLDDQAVTRPLVVHRFYDTRSATNVIPAQPGDFLIIHNGSPTLLELKSSSVHSSLRACFSSAVTAQQLAFHTLWNRAGAVSWFAFFGSSGVYELWPYFSCKLAREAGKPLKNGEQRTFSKLPELLETVLETHQ